MATGVAGYPVSLRVYTSENKPLFGQAFSALSYWGEFGSMIPVGVIEISPFALGSGKLGSPWERMHSVYLERVGRTLSGCQVREAGRDVLLAGLRSGLVLR